MQLLIGDGCKVLKVSFQLILLIVYESNQNLKRFNSLHCAIRLALNIVFVKVESGMSIVVFSHFGFILVVCVFSDLIKIIFVFKGIPRGSPIWTSWSACSLPRMPE